LITARLATFVVGAVTLIGLYIYGLRQFDRRRAILACGLLATSPFFLSFARVGFTETDVYLACALCWLLIALHGLQERRTLGRAAVVGLMLGLSLSAKATSLSVLPAVWYGVAQCRPRTETQRKTIVFVLGSVVLVLWVVAGVFFVNRAIEPGAGRSLYLPFFFVLFAGLFASTWIAFHHSENLSAVEAISIITALGVLTFFLLPPEHLTNRGIVSSVIDRFTHEMTYDPAFMLEAASLHGLATLFKSSPIIGAWLLLAIPSSILQWHRREYRVPDLVLAGYLAGLVLLPLAQTFYMIPLLPVLAVFAADQFCIFWSHHRRAAVSLAFVAVGFLVTDLARCYPDYNLNGYQWLGKRVVMGRSTIGYQSIVQVTSDGVQQAVEWVNEHARAGEVVRTYALSWHIVEATAPRPVYLLDSALDRVDAPNPDYVIVEINAEIHQSWWTRGYVFQPPYDATWLETNYTKVFSVPRAFGIEMASVWQSKSRLQYPR